MVASTTATGAVNGRGASGPVGLSFVADLDRLRELRARIAEGADPVFTLDGPRAQYGGIVPASVAINQVARPSTSAMAPTLWSMPVPPPPPAPPLGLSPGGTALSPAEVMLAKRGLSYAGDPTLARPANGIHSLPARPVDTMRPAGLDLPAIPTTDSAEMKRALSDERHQRLSATNNKSDVKPALAALQIPRDGAAAGAVVTSAIDSAASRESKHRRSSRGHGRPVTSAARGDDDDMDVDGVSLGGGSEPDPSTSSRRHRERDRDRDRERRREEREREDERERERKRERKAKKERRSRSPEPKLKPRRAEPHRVERSPELARSRRRSASPASRRRGRSPEPTERRSVSTRARSPDLPRSPDRPPAKKLEPSVRPPAPPQPPSPPVEPRAARMAAAAEAEPSAKSLKERLSRSGTTKPADLAIAKAVDKPVPAAPATAVRDLRERIGGRGEPAVPTPSSAPAPALLSRIEHAPVPPTPASAPAATTNGKMPVSAHSVVDPRKAQAAPAAPAPSLAERIQPNGAAPARRPPSPPRNPARYDRPTTPAVPVSASAPSHPTHQRLIDRIQPPPPEHHRPRPPSPPPRSAVYPPPGSYDRPPPPQVPDRRSYPPARYDPPPPVDTRPRDYYPPPPAPAGYDRPPYNEYDRRPMDDRRPIDDRRLIDDYPRSAGYDDRDRGFGRPPPPSAYPDRYGVYDPYPPPHSAGSSYDRPATPSSAYGYPPQPANDLRALYDRIQPARPLYAGSIESRPPPPPPQPPYPDDRRRDDRPPYDNAARAYYEQQQRSVGRPADYDPWRGR